MSVSEIGNAEVASCSTYAWFSEPAGDRGPVRGRLSEAAERRRLALAEQRRGDLGRTDTKASRNRNDHQALARALQHSGLAGARALSAHLAEGAAELRRLRKLLRDTSD